MEAQKSILVVDDTPTNRLLLKSILSKAGYHVIEAASGDECIELCKQELPSMILLDVMMPGINGIETCRRLREEHSKSDLPIIMVSTKASGADQADGFEAGANDYVTKPVDRKILITRLENELALSDAHRQIREQNRQIREALGIQSALGNALPDAMVVSDAEGKLVYANERLFDYCGGSFVKSLDACFETIFAGRLNNKSEELFEMIARDDSIEIDEEYEVVVGVIQNFRVLSRPIPIDDGQRLRLWLWRDMSSIRELERKANERVKLDTVSIFTSGVAHNFNNSLGAIQGAVDIIKRSDPSDPKYDKCLDIIRKAVGAASDFTKKISALSRRDEADQGSGVQKLSDFVSERLSAVDEKSKKSIDTLVEIEPTLFVEISDLNLADILDNVLENAYDALGSEGFLEISAAPCSSQNFVKLTFTDTGSGMDVETLKRVFEPFFSTKNLDHRNKVSIEGNGLGLWTVYNLVRAHGGEISVDSELGSGTVLSLTLPLSQQAQ